MRYLTAIIFLFEMVGLKAQYYDDHFGLGQKVGVTVSSSDESSESLSVYTLSGDGRPVDETQTSRFLAQATLGFNYDDINVVTTNGIDFWLDQQFSMPVKSFAAKYDEIYQEITSLITNTDQRNDYLSYAFYDMTMKDADLLRNKMAFALSQIFVVSPFNHSDLDDEGLAVANYYDILYQNAFGNYKTILDEVSLHPVMGIYLSHFQNQKADLIQGKLPDENYAREIMQLFSIGLLELNNDGTYKLDENGNTIPTYSIEEVAELAKVFTGFSGTSIGPGYGEEFDESLREYDLKEPMVLFQEYHDKREKRLLGSITLPANQNGIDDLNTSLEMLFNHPNVGPFMATRLIQHLIKSNPTPAYVNRVATAFNNNGQGVRGDLQAVVHAILTDPEARDASWISDPRSGKLIQPIERFTKLFAAFNLNTPSGKFWLRDEYDFATKLEQGFLGAPSVFNFFTPFYAEGDFVGPNNMVSPEFQILNANTGISYLNRVEDALERKAFSNKTAASSNGNSMSTNDADEPEFDFSEEIALYNTEGISALLDRVDLLLCRGNLSSSTRMEIENLVAEKIENVSSYDINDVIIDVIYFVMISPDFVILK